jgi:peptidoglycan/xylan/chitin deacetylase (PgdA/CDA1 family)
MLGRLFADRAFCLMLHRVAPHDPARLASNEMSKVSPTELERFIREALDGGYRFVSLSDALGLMAQKSAPAGKFIVMTLDDGYRDNLTNALPIFEKYGVPFILYPSTAFIGSGVLPWWHALEEILLRRDRVSFMGESIAAASMDEKNRAFEAVRSKILPLDDGESDIAAVLLAENKFEVGREALSLFLSWDELGAISRSGLAEIGNHGHRHLDLSACSAETVEREFTVSAEMIERRLDIRPVHYSFPYGHYDERTIGVLKSLGARSAVTVEPKAINKLNREGELPLIPRLGLYDRLGLRGLRAEVFYADMSAFIRLGR